VALLELLVPAPPLLADDPVDGALYGGFEDLPVGKTETLLKGLD
jgi:hypothetical protein